jgi:photosystem II stability/assembly factor-like uncharacterized protein
MAPLIVACLALIGIGRLAQRLDEERRMSIENIFALGVALGLFWAAPTAKGQTTPQPNSLPVQRVGSLPKGRPGSPIEVAFATTQEGWAYEIEGLWRTEDGGVSWTKQSLPAADLGIYDGQMLFRAQLTSTRRGWVQINDQVFRTDDAGLTWRPQRLPAQIVPPRRRLDGWYFDSDGEHGWVIVRQSPKVSTERDIPPDAVDEEHVFRSKNSGESWLSDVSAPHLVSTVLDPESHLYFRDATHGLLFDKSLSLTADGGRKWKPASFSRRCHGGQAGPLTAEIASVQFLDESLGWALANDGTLMLTIDGGADWCELQSPQQIWLRGPSDCPLCMNYTLHFWTKDLGSILRGPGLQGFQSTFLTTDGGNTGVPMRVRGTRRVSFVSTVKRAGLSLLTASCFARATQMFSASEPFFPRRVGTKTRAT